MAQMKKPIAIQVLEETYVLDIATDLGANEIEAVEGVVHAFRSTHQHRSIIAYIDRRYDINEVADEIRFLANDLLTEEDRETEHAD